MIDTVSASSIQVAILTYHIICIEYRLFRELLENKREQIISLGQFLLVDVPTNLLRSLAIELKTERSSLMSPN